MEDKQQPGEAHGQNSPPKPRRYRWLPRLLLDFHLYGGLILLGHGVDHHLQGGLEITLGLGLLSLFLLTVTHPALLHGVATEGEPSEVEPPVDENPLGRKPLRREPA